MLTIANFTGIYKLATNNINSTKINELITYYETKLMNELLGRELATEFYADLDVNNQPQTQKFIDIYEPLYFDAVCGKWGSDGLIETLKGLVYFAIVSEQYENNTMDGNVVNGVEVSNRSNIGAYLKYNSAVENYNVIQYYIKLNATVYPNFYGVVKRTTTWL